MVLNDIILSIVQLVSCVGLFVLTGLAEKYPNSKWRLFYIIPAFVCMFIVALTGYDKCMITIYTGSVILLSGFFVHKKSIKRIAVVVSALLTVAGIILCAVSPAYRSIDYLRNFEYGFSAMKERYLLTEHKQIDWDKLYSKYRPIFADITEESENIFAWEMFCTEFHDGHVNYSADESDIQEEVFDEHCGNDYGLVILNYDDGRAVAVDVDKSLNEIGIYNGTIIKTWNGLLPEEAAELSDMKKMLTYPDKENEYFYRSLFAAGTGSDSVEVVFIDNDGNEKTATLNKIGKYSDKVEHCDELMNDGIKGANMSFTEINNTTACLRIKMMLFDTSSSKDDDYSGMKNELRQKILELKEKGIKNIVIDIRSNGGGSGRLIKGIAELFAPEGEHFYSYDGVWDSTTNKYIKNPDGTYKTSDKTTFRGENILGDGKIIILVNAGSGSASEHFTKIMSGMENTTIMGFTKTGGSAQGITSIRLASGYLSASASLVLNEDGTIFIDSGADGISDIKLDVKVPFDENAVKSIFDNNEDYLMNKALEILE